MSRPRFAVEIRRAIPFAVFVSGLVLALLDLFAGVILQVSHFSTPRVVVAVVISLWAYRESRQEEPTVLPLIVVGALATAGGSLLNVVADLPFVWYDEYTTYSILIAMGIVSGAIQSHSRWTIWGWPLGVAGWALMYSLLGGRDVNAAVDWMIVAGATVAVLQFLVGTLVETATGAVASKSALADLHRALSRSSHALLEDASDTAMERALEELLAAIDADYAYVDVTGHDDDPPGFTIVAEAGSRPLPTRVDWMYGSYGDLPTVLAAHRAGQICEMRGVDLVGAERRLYEQDGMQSRFSVPIFVDGVWRGSMGFVSFTNPRACSPSEVDILLQAAGLVGTYWRRRDDHQRLQYLIQSKDELIASVSHELRTPLTGVVGLAEEMAASAQEMDPGTLAELAGLVADQSRDLAYLVEDLLVAARMESGALTVRSGEVDLLEEARAVMESVMEGIPVNVSGWDGRVEADPLRCRQILRNLLTNALRYGGEHVDLSISPEAEWVALTVSDDGDGVPIEDEERIFQPYVRSRVVAPGSIGVGLAVSRQLAQLMGGTLEYIREGGMTRFRLRLPRMRAERTDASIPAVLTTS